MSSAVQRRCHAYGCGYWYPKTLPHCPRCMTPAYAYNKGLMTAKLNSHLHKMAETA